MKMDDKRFTELIKELRNTRIYRDQAYDEMIALDKKLKETNEYKAFYEALDKQQAYSSKVIELEKQLHKELGDDPNFETPYKAAWTVNTTVVVLDQDKALAWAKKYMPLAVIESLDEAPIKDWVKRYPEYGKEIAKIEEKKVAKIAKDLTKFNLGE